MEQDGIKEVRSQKSERKDMFERLIQNISEQNCSGSHQYGSNQPFERKIQRQEEQQKPHSRRTKHKTTVVPKKQTFEICEKIGKREDQFIDNCHEHKKHHGSEQQIVGQISSIKKKERKRWKLDEIESKHILKEKNLKKNTKKFTFSKFLAKLFKKYYREYEYPRNILQINSGIAKSFQSSKKNDQSMGKHISKILGIRDGEVMDRELNKVNRLLMWKIMNDHIKDEVIFKPRLREFKRSYFLSMKVYRIRCRFASLPQKSCYR